MPASDLVEELFLLSLRIGIIHFFTFTVHIAAVGIYTYSFNEGP